MATMFFGFALADSMFSRIGNCTIHRYKICHQEARHLIHKGVTPCLNPSHAATISAMKLRYGIEVEIPQTPPRVELEKGDSIIIMGVRGLPRLTDRHEYTSDEIAEATFEFAAYAVS